MIYTNLERIAFYLRKTVALEQTFTFLSVKSKNSKDPKRDDYPSCFYNVFLFTLNI